MAAVDELTRLFVLHRAGALSAPQFAHAKAAVLRPGGAAPAVRAAARPPRKGAGGELQIFIRETGQAPRAVEIRSDATVADLHAAVGVMAHRKLRYGGDILSDPSASLSDLGLCGEAVIDIDAMASEFFWDGDFASPGSKPSYYKIDAGGQTVQKETSPDLTYNIVAKPAKNKGDGEFFVRIRVDAIPTAEFARTGASYEDQDKPGCDQRQHDGIGIIYQSCNTLMCSSGARLRMHDGRVLVNSSVASNGGGEVRLPQVREGDIVEIHCAPSSGGGWDITFTHQGQTESVVLPPNRADATVRPCVQCEKVGWKFTFV